MKAFNPYLNFDGNTREAMTFYKECLGAELDMQSFKDVGAPTPPGAEDRIMHARLHKGNAVIMASDTLPGMQFVPGNYAWVNIDCETVDEIERYFNALSAGGTVLMPLADQFWGARFGMLKDKFGMQWMMNCELKKS